MSYKKVVVSGNVLEVYEMDYEPYTGVKDKDKDDFDPFSYRKQLDLDDMEKGNNNVIVNRIEERRKQTARDARNKVKRLALENFNNNSKFITLTFKENITDVDKANIKFKSFMRKLRERTKMTEKLKYIAVIEFQDRGAVHYHMLCNIPFTPHEILYEWWKKSIKGEGTVNIQNISNVDNVGAYIVKYMMKNAGDNRLKGRKMYLVSRGLDKPKTYTGYSAEMIIKTYKLQKEKEIFTNSYESEYLGKITYKEYNLNPNELYRKTREKEKEIEEEMINSYLEYKFNEN